MIGHRRQRYGIFLAKGFEAKYIHRMLYFQTLIASFIGLFVAWLMMTGVTSYLEYRIRVVARRYKETLNLADFNILPLGLFEYFIAFFIVLACACGLIKLILHFMPLKERTSPAHLLNE